MEGRNIEDEANRRSDSETAGPLSTLGSEIIAERSVFTPLRHCLRHGSFTGTESTTGSAKHKCSQKHSKKVHSSHFHHTVFCLCIIQHIVKKTIVKVYSVTVNGCQHLDDAEPQDHPLSQAMQLLDDRTLSLLAVLISTQTREDQLREALPQRGREGVNIDVVRSVGRDVVVCKELNEPCVVTNAMITVRTRILGSRKASDICTR